MSFEFPQQNTERNWEEREQHVHHTTEQQLLNDMVLRLQLAPEDNLAPYVEHWVDSYGEKFLALLGNMIDEDPDLIDRWYELPDTASRALVPEIEEKLYAGLPLEEAGFERFHTPEEEQRLAA